MSHRSVKVKGKKQLNKTSPTVIVLELIINVAQLSFYKSVCMKMWQPDHCDVIRTTFCIHWCPNSVTVVI